MTPSAAQREDLTPQRCSSSTTMIKTGRHESGMPTALTVDFWFAPNPIYRSVTVTPGDTEFDQLLGNIAS